MLDLISFLKAVLWRCLGHIIVCEWFLFLNIYISTLNTWKIKEVKNKTFRIGWSLLKSKTFSILQMTFKKFDSEYILNFSVSQQRSYSISNDSQTDFQNFWFFRLILTIQNNYLKWLTLSLTLIGVILNVMLLLLWVMCLESSWRKLYECLG